MRMEDAGAAEKTVGVLVKKGAFCGGRREQRRRAWRRFQYSNSCSEGEEERGAASHSRSPEGINDATVNLRRRLELSCCCPRAAAVGDRSSKSPVAVLPAGPNDGEERRGGEHAASVVDTDLPAEFCGGVMRARRAKMRGASGGGKECEIVKDSHGPDSRLGKSGQADVSPGAITQTAAAARAAELSRGTCSTERRRHAGVAGTMCVCVWQRRPSGKAFVHSTGLFGDN